LLEFNYISVLITRKIYKFSVFDFQNIKKVSTA